MGEADSYFNPGQPVTAPPPPQPPQYGSQPYGVYQPPPNPPPQPQYGPPPNTPPTNFPPTNGDGEFDEKLAFDQTFKIEKPKWNDLWAGILVGLATVLSFDR